VGPGEALAAAAFAAVAGCAQSLTGFGFALTIVPPLTMVLGPRDAVVVSSLLGVVVSSARLLRTRRHIAWGTAGRFVSGSLVGLPVGLLVLGSLDERVLQAVIAVTVLVFATLLARGVGLELTSPGSDVGVGVVSGMCATATGMSGPPLVVVLQSRGVEPDRFRATLAATFVAMGLLSVSLFASAGRVTGERVLVALAAVPGLAGGFALGEWLFLRVDRGLFRRLVVAMLFVSAALALVTLGF
jgi:uncharacterized membrane protein YfcA